MSADVAAEHTMQLPQPEHPLLVAAIENKIRLSCRYHGKLRIIEPQCYGVGHQGRELVRVHQLKGGGAREPLFFAAEITAIQLVGTFTKPGPNYTQNDSAMTTIFAQL